MEQKQKVLIVQTKWQTENHERTEKRHYNTRKAIENHKTEKKQMNLQKN